MRQPRPDDPLEPLWQAPAIIWTMAAGEGLAAMLTLALGDEHPLRFFGTISLVIQWILLLTLAELYVLRRWLARWRQQAIAQIALALLLANAWGIATVAWLIFQPAFNLDAQRWNETLLRMLGIVLLAGAFGLVAFHMHANARRLAVRAKQAQLEILQARIQPHFLFNTLNTAVALVRAKPGLAEQLLLDLSDLFRAALRAPRIVPLAEELAMTRRYLEIEALRLGDRLRLEWNVPDELPDVDVPSLSIQPLAENAVRHGVEPATTGGVIEVSVQLDDDHACVSIRNDVAPDAIATPGHHIGLESARERIVAIDGGRARLDARMDGTQHVVTVRLPLRDQVTTR